MNRHPPGCRPAPAERAAAAGPRGAPTSSLASVFRCSRICAITVSHSLLFSARNLESPPYRLSLESTEGETSAGSREQGHPGRGSRGPRSVRRRQEIPAGQMDTRGVSRWASGVGGHGENTRPLVSQSQTRLWESCPLDHGWRGTVRIAVTIPAAASAEQPPGPGHRAKRFPHTSASPHDQHGEKTVTSPCDVGETEAQRSSQLGSQTRKYHSKA